MIFSNNILCSLSVVLLLLCAVGCENHREQLATVGALIESGECDSALHLLSAMEHKRGLSNDDRAECYLLQVKALYRLYRVLANDSLINYSIATFRYNGNDSLLADAYYYKGAMASDRDKDKGYVKVMRCLKAAESIANKHHYVELLKKIYDRASNYNIVAGEYKRALLYAKKQQMLVSESKDNYFHAYAIGQLLKAYFMLGEKDSVRKYQRLCWEVKRYIPSNELPDYLNDLYVTLGLIAPDSAITCFGKLIRNHPSALYKGNLAFLIDKTGQHAKADSIWTEALNTANLFDKFEILLDMIQRKQEDGRYQDAVRAQDLLNAVSDSMEHQYRADAMGSVVDDSTSKLYHGAWARNTMLFFLVLVILLLFFSLAIYFYHRKLRKRMLMFYELSDELTHTRGDMEKSLQKEQEKVSMLEDALEKLRQKHVLTFSHGRQLYEEIKAGQSVSFWKKQDFIDFIDYYMSVDFKFLQFLHDSYKELTPSEIFFLILLHEGYDEIRIKKVLAISDTALRVRKSRVNKKRRDRNP